MKPWIGVDLDGVLARFDGWKDGRIGDPIPATIERVKAKLAEGIEVRIFTARVGMGAGYSDVSQRSDDIHFVEEQRRMIEEWCEQHIGQRLLVTAMKDWAMLELWDDRCVQFVPNTGIPVTDALVINQGNLVQKENVKWISM